MTLEELGEKVRKWDLYIPKGGRAIADAKYSIILDQLYYHSKRDWSVYLPTEHSEFTPSYMERLAAWLDNVESEDDQKLLLQYALYMSFFSHEDFIALYRTAMSREVFRWVAKEVSADLLKGYESFSEVIEKEVYEQTWFCPVTDSMDINEFYKVNHIKGIAHRPAFATMQMLAEMPGNSNPKIADGLLAYMNNPSRDSKKPTPALKRVVLLEDIVGSGTQSIDAIRWAIKRLGKPVLFIPLILCPNGAKIFREEELKSGGLLAVRPIVEIRRCDILGPEREGNEGWSITHAMENLITKYPLTVNSDHYFGFLNTGCSVATFTNTPNNSVSIIHKVGGDRGWKALFPRIYRGA